MTISLPSFPAHPAFVGLGAHFAKLAAAGDAGALRALAQRQAVELNKQLRIAGGRRPDRGQDRRDYDIIISRMGRDKVDATDLISLISWLESVAAGPSALASYDAALDRIRSADDITRFLHAAE